VKVEVVALRIAVEETNTMIGTSQGIQWSEAGAGEGVGPPQNEFRVVHPATSTRAVDSDMKPLVIQQ